MQNHQPLTQQHLQNMQQLYKKINRKEFCELHGISQSKLSRILTGEIEPSFELLDYMAMHCGYRIKMELIL